MDVQKPDGRTNLRLKNLAAPLWVLGGVLFMLPSVLGNGRTELIPIGIVFLVVGISTSMKDRASSLDADSSEN